MTRPQSSRGLWVRRALSAGLALSALSVAGSASADPAAPQIVADYWKLPCVPQCTLCHLDASGGPGRIRSTTNQLPGFGDVLKSTYNVDIQSESSIKKSLDDLKNDGWDTDSDGTPDYDELIAGGDPNDPSPGAKYQCANGGPEFGCVRVAKQGPVDGFGTASALLTLLVGIAALRRRFR